MISSRLCPECNASVDSGAIRCEHCGYPINTHAVERVRAVTHGKRRDRVKRNRGVIVACIAVVAIYAFMSSRKKPEPPEVNPEEQLRAQLVGKWEYPGKDWVTYKVITQTTWELTEIEKATGRVGKVKGGTYALRMAVPVTGWLSTEYHDEYIEYVDHSTGASDKDPIQKDTKGWTFYIKVNGDEWHHDEDRAPTSLKSEDHAWEVHETWHRVK